LDQGIRSLVVATKTWNGHILVVLLTGQEDPKLELRPATLAPQVSRKADRRTGAGEHCGSRYWVGPDRL